MANFANSPPPLAPPVPPPPPDFIMQNRNRVALVSDSSELYAALGWGNSRNCSQCDCLQQGEVVGTIVLIENFNLTASMLVCQPVEILGNTTACLTAEFAAPAYWFPRAYPLCYLDAMYARRHFVVNQGASLTLRKVALINGLATDETSGGGAVYAMKGSNLTVDECIFRDCSALDSIDGGPLSGGAILMQGGGSILRVLNTLFEANIAADSGGAVSLHDSKQDSTVVIVNSTFLRNVCLNGNGGAITLDGQNPSHRVEDSKFVGNEAQRGAGGAAELGSYFSVRRCNFTANLAQTMGGAVVVGLNTFGAYISTTREPSTIAQTNFSSNRVIGLSPRGGALAVIQSATLTLNGNRFIGNSVQLYQTSADSTFSTDKWLPRGFQYFPFSIMSGARAGRCSPRVCISENKK